MKVLFISNYKENSGYSYAGQAFILALDAAGINVCPRNITITGSKGEVDKRILELEQQTEQGADICIQCTLPHMTEYNGNFDKNICLFFNETSHFRNNNWAERLTLMDEVWVSSDQQVLSCLNSGVSRVRKVNCPVDTSIFEVDYEPLNLPCPEDNFVFYTIGELNPRKNVKALIQAFHLEFDGNEPVELVIKGNVPGLSPADSMRVAQNDVATIKNNLKLYSHEAYYKSEIFITKKFADRELLRLHSTCDCFVSASHGEAICIPALYALGFGKTPIVTSKTGMEEFINSDNGYIVDSNTTPVFGMIQDTFSDLYCGNEDWKEIDIAHLRGCMREAFKNRGNNIKSEQGRNDVYNYSLYNIGCVMKEYLEGNKLFVDDLVDLEYRHRFKRFV